MGWGLIGLVGLGVSSPALASAVPDGNGATSALVAEGGASRPVTEGSFLGVVIPENAVEVSPRFESRVVELVVEVGDSVRQGDVLARLDTRTLQQELAAAQAALQGSRAEEQAAALALSQARKKKKRYFTPRALELGVFSADELDTTRYEESTAAARLQAARARTRQEQARVVELRQNVDEATLVAPFDGVVAAKLVSPGARVAPGEPVFRLLGTGGWKVRFAVPEDTARLLQQGTPLRMKVAQRGLSLEGTLESIAPEVDAAARLVFAIADFNEPPPAEVSTGMVVQVQASPSIRLGERTGNGSTPTGATP